MLDMCNGDGVQFGTLTVITVPTYNFSKPPPCTAP